MVSVILPFYNPGAQLEIAIQSVLQQEGVELELLLVNNNSTDVSAELAKTCAERYPDKVVLLSEIRQGVVHAMNCGLRKAKYTWVARMDADDEWKPEKLRKQLSFAQEHPELEVIGTQVKFRSVLEKTQGFEAYVDWSNQQLNSTDIEHSIFTESPLVNPSILFKKSLIELFGSYEEGEFPEDYEMFLRWHSRGVQMGKVPGVLMTWNDSAARLTRNHEAYVPEAFNRIKCLYLAKWLKERKGEEPKVWIWGAGRKTRKKVAVLEDHGIHVEGYIDLKVNRTQTKPCISFKEVNKATTPFVLSFVSNRGKGEEIRQYLKQQDFVELEDFVIAG